jgi:5-methylcytosine-specific restriction endonuclease McrA
MKRKIMRMIYTYEIDHKLRLDEGGTNDVNNLIALCPPCHRVIKQ